MWLGKKSYAIIELNRFVDSFWTRVVVVVVGSSLRKPQSPLY